MTDIFVAPKHKEKANGKKLVSLAETKHIGSFSAFCQNPEGVHFQTQKKTESIVLFLRSHFLTNVSWIVISLFFAILPIIAAILLPKMNINFFSSSYSIRFGIIFFIFYYFIVFSYIFLSFLTWFYNIFILTTERVLDIDYSDIVIHNIAETKLSLIQDVNYTQSGFIPGFFNYGDLFVQTAGTERNFEALSIPKPRTATHIINQVAHRE